MGHQKSSRADLRRTTPLLVQTGVIATLLLLLVAFRADLPAAGPPDVRLPDEQERFVLEDEVPATRHALPPSPPPPPAPVEVTNDIEVQAVTLDLGDDLAAATVLPIGPPPAASSPAVLPEADEPEEQIFLAVEEAPHLLPSDVEGLRALQQSIKYPEIARRAGVEGRVIVQFVVDEQGRVRDPFVVRGIGAGCDAEALRAVRQLEFKPGRQRGKAVKVQMTLPVHFRLR